MKAPTLRTTMAEPANTPDRHGTQDDVLRWLPLRGFAHSRRTRLLRRVLRTADALGLVVAFALSWAVAGRPALPAAAAAFAATVPLWWLGAQLYALYDGDSDQPDHSTVDEVVRIFHLVTTYVWLGFLILLAADVGVSATQIGTFWGFAILLLVGLRVCARTFARRRQAYLQRAIIVGAGDVGQLLGRKLLQHPEYGISLVGFVDREPKERRIELADVPLLGEPDDLARIVEDYDADRVVIAFSNDRHDELLAAIRSLVSRNVQIDIVPRLFEALGPEFSLRTVEGVPLLGLTARRASRASFAIKRTLDIVAAGVVLVLIAPLFALVALLIKLDASGPVFFRQTRVGRDMREFTMLKFRTMVVETDESEHRAYVRQTMDARAVPLSNNLYKLERADVVTRTGAWLRRFSLDELPQLLNVLRGDMSLVGPRPCIPYELDLLEPHHFERFAVPAGITGLWQITARARSTFREALELDVAYAHNWSLGLDLRLLFRTPAHMLKQNDTV